MRQQPKDRKEKLKNLDNFIAKLNNHRKSRLQS